MYVWRCRHLLEALKKRGYVVQDKSQTSVFPIARAGFIIEEVTEIDQLGLIETQHRQPGAKRKTKGAGMGKRSKPPTFVFNHEIVGTEEYRQYFTPDGDAMLKMIGLGPSVGEATKL